MSSAILIVLVVLGALFWWWRSRGTRPVQPLKSQTPQRHSNSEREALMARARDIRVRRETKAAQPVEVVPAFDAAASLRRIGEAVRASRADAPADDVQPPACPSCGTILNKYPQRKTKCKACGEFMLIRSTPSNRERRLMTQAQADAAERAWGRHYADQRAKERAKVMQPALEGDRDAVLEMLRLSLDDEEGESWKLLLIEIDLAKLERQGIRSVQLSAGTTRDRLCPACKALDQSIISVHAGARAVMPPNCTCLSKGLLGVSGWIKRPDGSGYVDQG